MLNKSTPECQSLGVVRAWNAVPHRHGQEQHRVLLLLGAELIPGTLAGVGNVAVDVTPRFIELLTRRRRRQLSCRSGFGLQVISHKLLGLTRLEVLRRLKFRAARNIINTISFRGVHFFDFLTSRPWCWNAARTRRIINMLCWWWGIFQKIHFLFGGFQPHQRVFYHHKGVFLLLQYIFMAIFVIWIFNGWEVDRGWEFLFVDSTQEVRFPLHEKTSDSKKNECSGRQSVPL